MIKLSILIILLLAINAFGQGKRSLENEDFDTGKKPTPPPAVKHNLELLNRTEIISDKKWVFIARGDAGGSNFEFYKTMGAGGVRFSLSLTDKFQNPGLLVDSSSLLKLQSLLNKALKGVTVEETTTLTGITNGKIDITIPANDSSIELNFISGSQRITWILKKDVIEEFSSIITNALEHEKEDLK